MTGPLLAVVLAALPALEAPPVPGSPHFDVIARFRPGKTADSGEVAVTFEPKDPDVHVNTNPAPRLKLDLLQKLLADKPGAKPAMGTEKYVDTTFPVVFPVSVLSPVKGEQTVKASLVYYYCSQREGWCRKGSAELEIPVKKSDSHH
jgi:hypothetical protein